MRTVLLYLLLIVSGASSAQNVLDSVQVYDFPVRQGTIYKYEYDCNSTTICAPSLSIVSVITSNDSVFHFEEGKVVGVFTLDDFHTVTIRNAKDEFITYSNLREVNVHKGDMVHRDLCLGIAGPGEESVADLNQVDILILKKVKQLPYRKALEYVRYNMSVPGKSSRYISNYSAASMGTH